MSFDVVFISYKEPNAEENFQQLKSVVTHGGLARVRDVEGITNAHEEAAKRAGTPWFYVVDGDNWVYDTFKFDHVPDGADDTTYVWHCKNVHNGLVYGYAGIKLFNRRQLLDRIADFKLNADMTTGLFKHFHLMDEVASETRFITEGQAFKAAFRECAKLTSKQIVGQIDEETNARLKVWLKGSMNDEFAGAMIIGAMAGKEFAEDHDDISKINDFEWLTKQMYNWLGLRTRA